MPPPPIPVRTSQGSDADGFSLPSEVISKEPLGVQRGVNAPWSHGGLARRPSAEAMRRSLRPEPGGS